MSWSVSAVGTPAEVRGHLSEQFKYPLADKPAGIDDEGERETVKQTSDLIEQILSTFDPEVRVAISASGHMAFSDWNTKKGAYQSVNLTITPQS